MVLIIDWSQVQVLVGPTFFTDSGIGVIEAVRLRLRPDRSRRFRGGDSSHAHTKPT
jgi:hypothetical protein